MGREKGRKGRIRGRRRDREREREEECVCQRDRGIVGEKK